MEAQDLRISRLEELANLTAQNHTELLRFLQEQSQRLDALAKGQDEHLRILQEHTRILQEHTRILQEHSRILQEHSKSQQDHSERLEKLETVSTRIVEELVAIREILTSSRGMGFAPDPGDSE